MRRATITIPDKLEKAVERYRASFSARPSLTAVVQAALEAFLLPEPGADRSSAEVAEPEPRWGVPAGDGAAGRPRRLEVVLGEELATALERAADAVGLSVEEWVHRLVRERVAPRPQLADDPLAAMVGVDDFDPGAVDDVVYG